MQQSDYRIHLQRNSPWRDILPLFPLGMPTSQPFPTGKGTRRDGKPIFLWSIPIAELAKEQIDAIAQTIAKKFCVEPEEVLAEAERDGDFGIDHHWVERFEGDSEEYSLDDREILGRTYRVFLLLGKAPAIPFRIDLCPAIIFVEHLRAALRCPWNKGNGAQTILQIEKKLVDFILPALPIAEEFLKRDWMKVEPFPKEKLENILKEADKANTLLDFNLSPTSAYHLVGQMQLLFRNPNFVDPNNIGRQIATGLQERIMILCPEATELLEMGWHPEFDIKIPP